jgi:hypothetical protein
MRDRTLRATFLATAVALRPLPTQARVRRDDGRPTTAPLRLLPDAGAILARTATAELDEQRQADIDVDRLPLFRQSDRVPHGPRAGAPGAFRQSQECCESVTRLLVPDKASSRSLVAGFEQSQQPASRRGPDCPPAAIAEADASWR